MPDVDGTAVAVLWALDQERAVAVARDGDSQGLTAGEEKIAAFVQIVEGGGLGVGGNGRAVGEGQKGRVLEDCTCA